MDTSGNEDVKQRFQLALEMKGMTQQSLSEKLFVTRATVTSWMKNHSIPTRHLAALSTVLDVSLDWLLHGIGPMRLSSFAVHMPVVNGKQSELIRLLRASGVEMVDAMLAVMVSHLRLSHGVDPSEMLELRNFAEHSRTAIVDEHGHVLQVSKALLKWLGLPDDSHPETMSLFAMIDESDLPELLSSFSAWQSEDRPQRKGVVSCRLKHGDGYSTEESP